MRLPFVKYSAECCAFCDAPFRANDVVQSYPVGRRIAYDPAAGRLWAVCGSCSRWNMAALDDAERAEAIEELEQHFHASIRRGGDGDLATAQVGKSGRVTLLRVGGGSRSRFVGWRHARRIQWRRAFYVNSFVGLALAQHYPPLDRLTDTAAGFIAYLAFCALFTFVVLAKRVIARVPLPDGTEARLTGWHEQKARIEPLGDGRFALVVAHERGMTRLEGEQAERMLVRLLTRCNAGSGAPGDLDRALELIAQAGGAERFMVEVLKPGAFGIRGWRVQKLPLELTLAMEVALHEESERRNDRIAVLPLKGAALDARDRAAVVETL